MKKFMKGLEAKKKEKMLMEKAKRRGTLRITDVSPPKRSGPKPSSMVALNKNFIPVSNVLNSSSDRNSDKTSKDRDGINEINNSIERG
jgi:hypothetical protein